MLPGAYVLATHTQGDVAKALMQQLGTMHPELLESDEACADGEPYGQTGAAILSTSECS